MTTLLVGTLVIAAFVGYQIEEINWRVRVIRLKLIGHDLESVSWSELLRMLKPGSGFYLQPLVDTPNPYAVIRNPLGSPEDIEAGELIYASECMHCHGASGLGGTAPDIASDRLSRGDSDWAIFRSLKDGVAGTAMEPTNLTDQENWRVVGYLLNLRQASRKTAPENEKAVAITRVPYERIREAGLEPHNWLTYSGRYDGQRHSSLSIINRATLDKLRLSWVVQTDVRELIEASPIVVDGVMFLTLPESAVLAVDARTGEQIWRWDPELETDLSVCCGRVNRGVAILDDRIFVGTLDNRLQSLDAATGKLLWERTIADASEGYTITAAPLAVKDRVVIGVSGGEYGIRGFLDAYDARTGEQAWRFYTIPEPGHPGSESWPGDSWRNGGGPTWVTGSYDPILDLIYWGVGNPAPDFDGRVRAGDNLFTNSVVALDSSSGELRWFFQFTPHDLNDFDANQVPVLVDADDEGGKRELMLWANRNGFFYVLDRQRGQYLRSIEFARQTWASKIDQEGRPVRAPNSTPTPTGTLVWPGASGATNWWPPSYNPVTRTVYVPRLNRPSVFFNHEVPRERISGEQWLGSASTLVPDQSDSSVVAIDPWRMSLAWERYFPDSNRRGQMAGLVSTPELVFVGESNTMYVLDAENGEILISMRLGGRVGSPPITYSIDDAQYVTIAAGKNIYTFSVVGASSR